MCGLLSITRTGVSSIESDRSLPDPFAPPPGLVKQVEFWKMIFSRYHSNQVVLHDSENLSVVYRVIELGPDPRLSGRGIVFGNESIDREKRRILETIRRIEKKIGRRESLDNEETQVAQLVSRLGDDDQFQGAAQRIRAQRGLSDRFARGLEVSGRYLSQMERVFQSEGLPLELTRIPLIESSFNLNATSSVGASGIWQFMRSTGKRFLTIEEALDERRDPFSATLAAARLLKENYNALGDWALAITAYNHGKEGMLRAVRAVGTKDIVDVIRDYRGRAFGFASRNFYAEFLAALDVEKNQHALFSELAWQPPVEYEEIPFDSFIPLDIFLRRSGLSKQELIELNPALGHSVVMGKLYVPKGFRMKVPAGSMAQAVEGYNSIPEDARYRRQKAVYRSHRVLAGNRRARIARRYRVNVGNLKRVNAFKNPKRLAVGQRIVIPD